MAQLHFYVPDAVEQQLRDRARRAGVPLSRYLAELVKTQTEKTDEWPSDYFDAVFGGWQGERLERAPQGDYEHRADIK